MDRAEPLPREAGKMRIHMTAVPDEEIIVSKDKVATVKRWLDS